MVARRLVAVVAMLPIVAVAQEVLLPIGSCSWVGRPAAKDVSALALPFFDDFSGEAGLPDAALWQTTGGASVEADFAPEPPTIGVALMDSYATDGHLHSTASTALFGADTLTSHRIRLDGLSTADSVAISFFYLPSGGSGNMWERVGDTPERQDSLILQFCADTEWVTVWATPGVSVDTLIQQTGTAWQYACVAIREDRWFDSTFRFRFRNLASLEDDNKAGRTVGGDQWCLDYVLLDRGRDTAEQPQFHDLAFAAPAPSMLTHYRAMPARQYRQSDMAQHISLRIANLYSAELASHYGYSVVDRQGDTLYAYDGGYENAPARGIQHAQAHSSPPVGFAFPEGNVEADYRVVHTVREGTGGDSHPTNDTIVYHQHFGTYYAYDDGTAENGYGITSTASRIYLAYRFDLNRPDTITAVDLFFNRTYHDENLAVPFYLCVWQADSNGIPDELLYRDVARRTPVGGMWSRYELEHALPVAGSVCVGFEQVGNTFINLGFDRSFNTADRIYYLTGGQWQRSILAGSLLLRPCMGVAALGVQPPVAHVRLTVSPNPASGVVTVHGVDADSRMVVCDLYGCEVLRPEQPTFSVAHLPNGIYLLLAVSDSGMRQTAKIIVSNHQ